MDCGGTYRDKQHPSDHKHAGNPAPASARNHRCNKSSSPLPPDVPEAVHIVQCSTGTGSALRQPRPPEVPVIIVKFILDAHKPQKLHHGGPGVDNADFPSRIQ